MKKTLIEKIQEKYELRTLDPIIIEGNNSTIILERYIFEIEGNKTIDPIRIELKCVHTNNKTEDNTFLLSTANSENQEARPFFFVKTIEKLDRFIISILKPQLVSIKLK